MIPELDTLNCEIPGMMIILSYSTFLVMISGVFCLLVYLLAFMIKISHLLLSLACPIWLSKWKHNWRGIQKKDFSQYEGEFDFEYDISE